MSDFQRLKTFVLSKKKQHYITNAASSRSHSWKGNLFFAGLSFATWMHFDSFKLLEIDLTQSLIAETEQLSFGGAGIRYFLDI